MIVDVVGLPESGHRNDFVLRQSGGERIEKADRHGYGTNASAETPKRFESADTWRTLSCRLPLSTADTTL